MKSQFLSPTWFLRTVGLCREPEFPFCVPPTRSALGKECCCTQEDIKVVEPLGAVPKGGFKKRNELKALKTTSKYNHVWLKRGEVCS